MTQSSSAASPPPSSQAVQWRTVFLDALRKEGAHIQEGLFAQMDVFALVQQKELKTCNGNNANNPYFACALPKAPGQPPTVPDSVSVPNPKHPLNRLHVSIHLNPADAIVLVGLTPPEVKYFSHIPFLNTSRVHPTAAKLTERDLQGRLIRNKPIECVPEPGLRRILFAGLGDPLNNMKISTPGTPHGASGCPFEQLFMLIYASDEGVLNEVKVAARQAGYPDTCINAIVIPSDVVHLGVDAKSDELCLVQRVSNNPTDQKKFSEYLSSPPVDVFRITSARPPRAPLATPFLTPRGNGRTEFNLWKPTERLRQAILDTYQHEFDAIELTTDVWLNESYFALQQGVDNLGESRDTTYLATEQFVLPVNAFMVAYGVNHEQTRKAVYSNLVVYGSSLDNGVVSVASSKFAGSAAQYLDDPQASSLYAWKLGFQKIGTGSNSKYTVIPTVDNKAQPPVAPPYGLDPKEPIYMGFRAYLEPSTKVGPIWHELILDRVIVFLPKQR
ncbi:MAG TPA: hypothetical protein DCQ33_08825 [Nitrospira sp.]|nr:hypothetical protein [Nitrospira sp.]